MLACRKILYSIIAICALGVPVTVAAAEFELSSAEGIETQAAGEFELSTKSSKKFNGPYFGSNIGIGSVEFIDIIVVDTTGSVTPFGFDDRRTGFSFNAAIGFRHQFNNNVVLGVEGLIGDQTGFVAVGNLAFNFSRDWRATALVGRAFGNKSQNLVYGRVGVGGIRVSVTDNNIALADIDFEGVTGAIGYERALTKHIRLRFEAEYTAYDEALNFTHLRPQLGLLVQF